MPVGGGHHACLALLMYKQKPWKLVTGLLEFICQQFDYDMSLFLEFGITSQFLKGMHVFPNIKFLPFL